MPRPSRPEVRVELIERAASMLARRQPVTLRSLVDGTGSSTMAVYTHFGGMPGLWAALRQEGFTRLAVRLDAVSLTRDPVRDLAALSSAYSDHALAEPDLYRAMFDAAADLVDAEAAGANFTTLVDAAQRAKEAGRFGPRTRPDELATRWWAAGHGLLMLVLGGVLPADALDVHATATAVALFVAAGDDPARARRSVRAGWTSHGVA